MSGQREYTTFREFYEDDHNYTTVQRAEIEFQARLIGVLVETRERMELGQVQLPKDLDANHVALTRLENKKKSPRVDKLIELLTPMGYQLEIVPIAEES